MYYLKMGHFLLTNRNGLKVSRLCFEPMAMLEQFNLKTLNIRPFKNW
jgi:hypothetical protein